MPTNIYRKPKSKVIQVVRGKEVEQFPLDSLQAHGKHKGLTYQVVGKTGTQYVRE